VLAGSCLHREDRKVYFYAPTGELRSLSMVEAKPYFFLDANVRIPRWPPHTFQKTELRGDDGRRLVKVKVPDTRFIPVLRERAGVENTFEADIPYLHRLMIDGTVRYVPSGETVYLDIEVDDSKGFPDPSRAGEYRVLSVSFVDSGGREYGFVLGDYDSEEEMLRAVTGTLHAIGARVIAGWNVMFDWAHLSRRYYRLTGDSGGRLFYETVYPLDLRGFYKKAVKGLESYSLDEAAEHTLGEGKIKREKRVSSMGWDELLEYNMRDAVLTYMIDRELELSVEPLSVSGLLGVDPCTLYVNKSRLESSNTASALKVGDTVIIRRLRGLGMAARTRWHRDAGGVKYQGAFVLEPVPGIYENVAVFDFESLYPHVIMHEKIDVAGFKGEVLPYIEETMLHRRREEKRKCKAGNIESCRVQLAIKIIINSLYGLFGFPAYRYYDISKAEAVTAGGRRTILGLKKRIESELGLKVIYIDTDSVFVPIPPGEERRLEGLFNRWISPYRIKHEYTFKRILFLPSKTGEGGAKKRYVGILSSGELKWTGVAIVRSDYPRAVKDAIRSIYVTALTTGDPGRVEEVFREWESRLYRGLLDEELIVCKGVRANYDYRVNAQHVKAYKRALEQGYKPELDRICYIITYPGEPVPVIPGGGRVRPWYSYYRRIVFEEYERVRRVLSGERERVQSSLDQFF